MSDYYKKIVEFFGSGALKLGCVTGLAKNRLQVVDQNGKNVSIAPKQILVVHPLTAEPSNIGSLAQELESKIKERQEEVDCELLWASVREDQRSYGLDELSEQYFGEADSIAGSAIFRALSEDRLHFKIKGLDIRPRTEEQVAEQIRVQELHAEKEAYRQRLDEWVRKTLESDEPEPAPQEMEPVLDNVEDFLIRQGGGDTEKWLSELDPDLSAKEAAFALLVRAGRLPKDADPLLIIAGIDEHFPEAVEESCRRLTAFSREATRADYSALRPFSIDDSDTREIDDALTVESLKGGLRVGVHIADVSHFVSPGDPLCEEALRRSSSIYLPHRTVLMFPERLSRDLASLNQGRPRPVFSFLIDFCEDGRIRSWKMERGQLSVARRLNYEEADQLLINGLTEPLAEDLKQLARLSELLLEQRKEAGALTIRRPELKIRAENGEVEAKLLDPASVSRRIVSEFMILTNRLAAERAAGEGVPIIFRGQDPPAAELNPPETYDPVAMDKVFRKLKKSRFTLEPKTHSGLGLEAYTQVTSPIRRLVDLAVQQQFSAHLASQPPPHDEESLLRVMSSAQSAESDIRAVERKANRFYLLKYLQQKRQKLTMPAVAVAELRNGWLVETTDLFIRGRLRCGEKSPSVGEAVDVRIEKVDPEDDILTFRPA